MESLYHLTEEKYLPEILKNGLIPQIGNNSKIVDEKRERIYLCDYNSIPYWYIILNKPTTLLQINNVDRYTLVEYPYSDSRYREFVCEQIISSEKIKILQLNSLKFKTDEAMIELCERYLYSISSFCVMCARYYNNILGSRTEKDIILYGQSITFVLPNLEYNNYEMKEWMNILKLYGESGEYTFCDNYGNTENKLWQQLIDYPSDASEKIRQEIYNFIKDTFPFAETLDTGGFEIPKIFD